MPKFYLLPAIIRPRRQNNRRLRDMQVEDFSALQFWSENIQLHSQRSITFRTELGFAIQPATT